MNPNHHLINSPTHLQHLLNADLTLVSVLYFRADWAEPCTQMDLVINQLSTKYEKVLFLSIEAEALPDISESFEVDAVPYFILLRGHTLLTKISGAQPALLTTALGTHTAKPKSLSSTSQAVMAANSTYVAKIEPEDESEAELEKRCSELMKVDKVMLFMKGDRDTPRCGFSKTLIGILEKLNIEYSTFDILEDESVRQKLKIMNDWPTFPQLIIKGEFMGGLDVIKEMVENGELVEMLA